MSLFTLIDTIDRMLINLGPPGAAIRPHFFTLRDQLEALEERPKPRNNKTASEKLKKDKETIARLRTKLKTTTGSVDKEIHRTVLDFEARHSEEIESLKREQTAEVTSLNASLARFSAELRKIQAKQEDSEMELAARAARIAELENIIEGLRKKGITIPGYTPF